MTVDSTQLSNGAPVQRLHRSEPHATGERANSLREEVLELIKPYRTSGSPPHPFTTEELVVLAAIALGKQACTRQQICRYILRKFHEYREKVIDAACYEASKPLSWIPKCDFPRLNGFETAFGCYEVPLRPVDDNMDFTEPIVKDWAVDLPAARIFLGRHLAPRKGQFNILALPAELRVVIYEYALSYPPLVVDFWDNTGCRFGTSDLERPDLRTRTTPEILSITRVNRQMYREALPVFYAANHFILCGQSADSQLAFVNMLRKSDQLASPGRKPLCVNEPSRTQNITSISIDYSQNGKSDDDHAAMQQSLEHFLGVRRLKRLSVWLDEDEWFEPAVALQLGHQPLGRVYNHPRELPGIANLVQLLHRAEHCALCGDDGRIAQYIRSELERLKGESAALFDIR